MPWPREEELHGRFSGMFKCISPPLLLNLAAMGEHMRSEDTDKEGRLSLACKTFKYKAEPEQRLG